MIKRTKIMLVVPTLQVGGMERVMSVLANQWCEKVDLEIHLVLYTINPKIHYYLQPNITIHSNISQKKAYNNKFLKFFSYFFFIRNTAKKIKPNSILSFGSVWNILVLFSLAMTRNRVFISDRGSPNANHSFFFEILKNVSYRWANGIIAQTNKAKEVIEHKFPKVKTGVIPNPIGQISSMHSVLKRENIILTVGRLIKTKHHDRLIEIFANLKEENWRLVIVGGDVKGHNNIDRLQKMVDEKGLSDSVILAGERKDVFSYYMKSKIFAFTSSSEGFPNVIGEALSYGLPVISYDCVAGPSDMIIDGYNGFLTPVFSDDIFLEKLRYLIKHEELIELMSDNARKSTEKYSPEAISSKFLEFIL